uniref:Cyclin T1-3 n=1 Tax=Dimocarpus longan TaxID=128017 RepID=A0A8G0QX52_9ROSI|nr:cyclin T1-3 [Dimocarpus longan]
MANLLPGDPTHRGIYEVEPTTFSEETSEEGGRWYFSRKEIEENSPSKRDGIDLRREAYLRKSYCTFLQDLGMRLKVPQITIATAIIFCHRFFCRQSHAKNDRRTIATVCMFLAGKVEETPRPLKDVILVSYEIIHKKDKDPDTVHKIKQKEVFDQQKELILLGEKVVLSTLGFDLNVHHPYKPLVEAIKKFKVAQNALAQVAWNFVNDGLRTSLCLQFKPHHIAAGAIFLAAKFLKVKLPSDGEKVWWQEFDVTPRQLEEVSNQMLELYEQNRVPASQSGETVEGSASAGGNNRASQKVPSSSEEKPASTNSYSQASVFTSRSGSLKPVSTKPASAQPSADNRSGPSRTSQNQTNGWGSADMENNTDDIAYGKSKDDLHPEPDTYQNKVEVSTSRFGSDVRDEEDQGRVVRDETREVGEVKDKHFGRNLEHRGTVGQSPQDAIKKIDRDKVKAALEKRRKSRVDTTRKTDLMDEDDLIERELEDGIELAAGSEKSKWDRKQSWSKLSDRHEYENSYHEHQEDAGDGHQQMRGKPSSHASHLENVEEGEVPVGDDLGRGSRSPKSSNRKRKFDGSPGKAPEGKLRHSHGPGSNHYNHHDYVEDRNRMGRLGYMERDHKRHIPENHV